MMATRSTLHGQSATQQTNGTNLVPSNSSSHSSCNNNSNNSTVVGATTTTG